jgi:hypothetical protein
MRKKGKAVLEKLERGQSVFRREKNTFKMNI